MVGPVTTAPMAISKARQLAADIARHDRWAKATRADRDRQGRLMREAKEAKAIAEVDPDGQLTPDELAERLAHLQRAEMAKARLAKLRRKERGGDDAA